MNFNKVSMITHNTITLRYMYLYQNIKQSAAIRNTIDIAYIARDRKHEFFGGRLLFHLIPLPTLLLIKRNFELDSLRTAFDK